MEALRKNYRSMQPNDAFAVVKAIEWWGANGGARLARIEVADWGCFALAQIADKHGPGVMDQVGGWVVGGWIIDASTPGRDPRRNPSLPSPSLTVASPGAHLVYLSTHQVQVSAGAGLVSLTSPPGGRGDCGPHQGQPCEGLSGPEAVVVAGGIGVLLKVPMR